jgi:hypothetical protein
MTSEAAAIWQDANQRYLMASIGHVHRVVEKH